MNLALLSFEGKIGQVKSTTHVALPWHDYELAQFQRQADHRAESLAAVREGNAPSRQRKE